MRTLCVFCGSSPGARPEYAGAAEALAAEMVRRGVRLVYGGGRVGMMGILADAVIAEGGEAIGIIPEALERREVAHGDLTELRVVGSMHERKALMNDLSDGFAALPGGLGTFEELLEAYTWGQLGIHRKPVGILNVAGYYDRLLHFLDVAVEERFVRSEHRGLLIVEPDPAELLDAMARYTPSHVTKWIDSDLDI